MAMFISEAAAAAHRAHQADASCAGSLAAQRPCYLHRPNWALGHSGQAQRRHIGATISRIMCVMRESKRIQTNCNFLIAIQ
jgi:hypothetical protein